MYLSTTIVIKRFRPSDEQLFCDFFDDPEVIRYLPANSKKDYKTLFHKTFEDYQKGFMGRWGVYDTANGDFIGNCVLRILAEDESAMEIGYSIGKKYWGMGLGSEIVSALVKYTFSNTQHGDLTALTHPDNIASQKVLEKAGFVRNGNIERHGNALYLFRLERNNI